MTGLGWVFRGLGLLAVLGTSAGCPGTGSPGSQDSQDGSTGEPGITTFNSTIDPTLPGDEGSTRGEVGTTMEVAETTLGPSTTDEPSTTGTTSAGPGSTTDPETSTGPGSSTTDGGSSTGPGCNGGPGNYEYCLNMAGGIDTTPCMDPGGHTCLVTGMAPDYTGAVCSGTSCSDACDCPAAPMSGNAVVSCGDVTGDPANLFCYLDCSMGETCPTGMECFAGYLCVWPGPGAAGTPYGDCFNNGNSVCGLDGLCLNDGAMPTIGVCATACNVVGDCPAAPPGRTSPVQCTDVTSDMVNECTLDCSGGTTCPTGMSCFNNFICVWM